MDDVAPPPFRGMHEEPPDDMQIGLYDDEEENHDDSSHDPDNLPPIPDATYDYPDEIYVAPKPASSACNSAAKMESVPTKAEPNVIKEDIPSIEESSLGQTDVSEVAEMSLPQSAPSTSDDPPAMDEVKPTPTADEPTVIKEGIASVEEISQGKNDVPKVEEIGHLPSAPSTSDAPPAMDDAMEEDDDFGDFADFTSAPVPSASATSQAKSNDDDDWGGFGAPGPLSSGLSKSVSVDKTEEDDEFWGDFAEPTSKPKEEDDSDWAADFKSAAPVEATPIVVIEPLESLEDLMDDEMLWTPYEDCCSDEDESRILNITDFLDSEDVSDLHEFHSSVHLWRLLRIVENADALKFEWKVAEINLNMLKHLKINNIAPPKKPESLSFAGSSTLQPTVLHPTKPEEAKSSKRLSPSPTVDDEKEPTLSSDPSHKNGHVAAAAESVPPVDFDWDDSGLTNPMNGAARSSALLDIDFLSANSGGSTSAASTLEKDLEDFGLSAVSSVAPSTSSVLNNLLSSAGVSTTMPKYKPVAELSLDAKALHDQLPDLDYLRSQIIMFPLGGIGNSFSG